MKVSVVPLNRRFAELVILVPSKYETPFATPPVDVPVPPYRIPIEVVAETTPAFAWSGPFNPPASVSIPVDENDEVAVAPNDAKFEESALAKSAVPVALVNVMLAKLAVPVTLSVEESVAAPVSASVP